MYKHFYNAVSIKFIINTYVYFPMSDLWTFTIFNLFEKNLNNYRLPQSHVWHQYRPHHKTKGDISLCKWNLIFVVRMNDGWHLIILFPVDTWPAKCKVADEFDRCKIKTNCTRPGIWFDVAFEYHRVVNISTDLCLVAPDERFDCGQSYI